MSNHLQICYFPYLFLEKRETVEFDEITVWNYSILKSQRITDGKIRNHVTQLLKANQRNGKPIKDIGLISIKNKKDFTPFRDIEQKKIDDLRKVLFLCSVARSNIYQGQNVAHRMVTSDNFTVVYQNFKNGDPYTAYQSGRIIPIHNVGYKIGEINYEAPRYVLRRIFTFDEGLLNALKKTKRKHSTMYRRILRATDAMMNGYTNSDDVSYESLILEQSRAFEILFDLPDTSQREELKKHIAQYCQGNKEIKRRYKSERRHGKMVWETNTRQVMWADRFYTLRNHIIHGEQLKNTEFSFLGQPHYHLGLWFFIASVKKILNDTLGKNIFHDTIRYRSGHFEYDNCLVIHAIDRALSKRKIFTN